MKKILLIAALLLSGSTAFSQTADKLFSDLKSNEGVEYMEITKEMMAMAGAMSDGKTPDQMKDIDNIKLMEINDDDSIGEMRLKLSSLEKGGYKVLMEQSEDGEQATIYTLTKGKVIKEMLMIMQDSNSCKLMLFKGKIDPNKLDDLMNFGGGDDD